ncbi:galactose-1-phosphate uridylyltransferase [Arcobacter sp. FWKO B]|uniref:galactose-1-phosphate uridylyltransferase n=1 Tax=Arcobacter sp. FWKO B TaxID=2593672 RepID=UPI0018A3B343|nr:galactose-1-phosphate uridylyltransferase [Arcobacter sp. FWKO B]QOG11462.1 galactose-1-phosphate uridylyltransferase [Arcobacter sp. FWKO B]
MVYINFIWHMHQPYYRDNLTGKTKMPWVFLHAIKDYYDMPYLLSQNPNIKATFNLVPSLIEQLNHYINNDANDELLDILTKDVSTLKDEQLEFLNSYLFTPNEKNMINIFWRYKELNTKFKSSQKGLKIFDESEIEDAQVLFLLSWCGNYLKKNNKTIKNLITQGANYNHTQKLSLINELIKFLPEILKLYKKLAKKGQIELSTTPYYHPILPLLLDINSAKTANANTNLPNIDPQTFKEFGKSQITKAIELFEQTFDFKPTGFWPAEGSVSEATIKMISKHDIKWIATDEEVLYKSIKNHTKEKLYNLYQHKEYNTYMFFRDRHISDLIGFEYSKLAPQIATLDFIDKIKNIQLHGNKDYLVSVILDGENAWEFYENNGEEFFNKLYKTLEENNSFIKTILPSEAKDLKLEKISIDYIHPGSWINANFDIWIGKPQKNKAWELLALTKEDYIKSASTLNNKTNQKILEEFAIALGSDWFWWYDDDHFTTLKPFFDNLFRLHLQNIYTLMGQNIPQQIIHPIVPENEVILAKFGAMHQANEIKSKESEFRYCKLTKRWVLFAPKRADRPNNFIKKKVIADDCICPFDAGNENLTPKEILRIGDSKNWRARVVPNLYNVLSIDIEPEGKKDDYFDVFSGFGAHEVIIETPKHGLEMFDYSLQEFVDYLQIAKDRLSSLKLDTRLNYASLFKNHGSLAGASLSHSHSQIIALPFVPTDVADEIDYKKEYYKKYKRAILDDLVYEEKQYEENLIFENESFVCYAPYASRFPYEVKIVAKDEYSCITEFDETTLINLAKSLELIFKKYKNVLDYFSFNMLFKNHPYEGHNEKSKDYFRFYVNIFPRLSGIAGFELDSKVYLNSILPSVAASRLKEV